MRAAHHGLPAADFEVPSGISMVTLYEDDGRVEPFLEGTEPGFETVASEELGHYEPYPPPAPDDEEE
jgi:hypothetical protein